MRLAAPCTLALALASAACRHRRVARRAPAATGWVVRAASGPALRVEGPYVVVGGLRLRNGAAAPGPVPAGVIAATARVADGSWRFAADDGTVYRSDRFDGVLQRAGALPFRLSTPAAGRAVHSVGALVVLDASRRARVVTDDGVVELAGGGRALAACAVSRDEVLAVVEPGVLRVSRDGGRTTRELRAPAGVALSVWLDDGEAVVRTTAGTFRWSQGALSPAQALAPAAWLAVDPDVVARASAAVDPSRASWGPGEAAMLDARRVAVVRGRTIDYLDARTGAAVAREDAPGDGCTLTAAYEGVRARCRHLGWASAIYARAATRPGWTVLRDEARAEPVGDAVFDDVSRAWMVHAPCAQRPTADATRACLVDAAGASHDVTLPAGATLAAMHDGEALAVTRDAAGRAVSMRRVGAGVSAEVPLPDGLETLGAVRWSRDGIALLHGVFSAGGRVLRSTLGRDGTWRHARAPDGVERAVFTSDGAALAWGAHAGAVAMAAPGAGFARVSVPGAGESLALDLDAPAYCVGPWCRVGGRLTWGPGPSRAALARDTAAPEAARDDAGAVGEIRCDEGAVTRAPEIDRGVAVSGHAVQARLRGVNLEVTWSGETLRGAVRGVVPVRGDARVSAWGVVGSSAPGAVVAVCAEARCDHWLAHAGGLTDLGLGRAVDTGVRATLRDGGGWVARADDARDGVTLVTLVALDARGSVEARQTFAFDVGADHVHVGAWEGRDGLWLDVDDGRLRFTPLDPAGTLSLRDVSVPAWNHGTRTCGAETAPSRAVVRQVERLAQVRGAAWFVELGEWQVEARLEGDADATCLRAIAGGEARDEAEARASGREEREPVRSFAVRAAGGDALVGRAWSGERGIALRCRVSP